MSFSILSAVRCFFLLALAVAMTAPPTFAQTAKLSRDTAYKMALSAWSNGNQKKAEVILDEYANWYPGNEKLDLFRAACARSRNNIEKADEMFFSIVQRARRTGKAASKFSLQAQCALLMLALDTQRRPETSFVLLENLAARNAKDPMPIWLLAMADRTYDRKIKAVAAYRRVIKIAPPGSPLVHQVYASLLDGMGRYKEALVSRRKAAQSEPTAANLNELGSTLFALHRYEEATTLYQRATQIDPTNTRAWNELGKTLIEQQHYPEAAEALAQANTLDSGDPDTLYYWGLCLEKQGDYPEALAKFKKALEAKPDVSRTRAHTANVLDHLGLSREAQTYREAPVVKAKQ